MPTPTRLSEHAFLVGSDGLSGAGDCCVYAIGLANGSTCLIDAGTTHAGRILVNIEAAGLEPQSLQFLVLTHFHYDHCGAAHEFKARFPVMQVYAHELDAPAIEGAPGTAGMTAASWYGETYMPVGVDMKLHDPVEVVELGGTPVEFHHVPGHTPGSIAVVVEDEGQRVLLGQDIHGPFLAAFQSSIEDWAASMHHLLDLDADILGEGHFGVIKGKANVRAFIEGYLRDNGYA
jgi:glyoxylase-like metal-dependent hydrolase (beta-lactamase superfamily II)